jgi:hypothetical protein
MAAKRDPKAPTVSTRPVTARPRGPRVSAEP